MKKYKIPVIIVATASKVIGEIECDSLEEYNKKVDEFLKKKGFPSIHTNISNDFEVGDSEIEEVKAEDLTYYKQNT